MPPRHATTGRAPPGPFLLLGCGYTASRLARRLLAGGSTVIATTRDPAALEDLSRAGADVRRLDLARPATLTALGEHLPGGLRLLCSIPPLVAPDGGRPDPSTPIATLADRLVRVVYLSSTGVYGSLTEVDEATPPAPETPQQRARRAAEERVLACGLPALVLRAPAIYGPGRGVHALMRAGRYRLVGRGENVGSRIHVDDLAEHARAALGSDLVGAWPVADDGAATAAEVAAFCARRMGLPMPPSARPEEVGETQRVTRRVDGRAVRARLGIRLRHPTYVEGIEAALAEEDGVRALRGGA
jgi:nucleoside-diphosphate-sugar epimerase